MGNSNRKAEQYDVVRSYQPEQWINIQNRNGFEIWQNPVRNIQAQAYHMNREITPWDLDHFQLRHTNFQNIPKIHAIRIDPSTTLCSSNPTATIFLQRIPARLSEVYQLTHQEALTILQSAYSGFNTLSAYYGLVEPYQDLICFNENGAVKVWVNGNLVQNRIESDRLNNTVGNISNANQIYVNKIFNMVQNKTINYSLPELLKNKFRQYRPRTYLQALNTVQNYAKQNNIKIRDRIDNRRFYQLGDYYNQQFSYNINSQYRLNNMLNLKNQNLTMSQPPIAYPNTQSVQSIVQPSSMHYMPGPPYNSQSIISSQNINSNLLVTQNQSIASNHYAVQNQFTPNINNRAAPIVSAQLTPFSPKIQNQTILPQHNIFGSNTNSFFMPSASVPSVSPSRINSIPIPNSIQTSVFPSSNTPTISTPIPSSYIPAPKSPPAIYMPNVRSISPIKTNNTPVVSGFNIANMQNFQRGAPISNVVGNQAPSGIEAQANRPKSPIKLVTSSQNLPQNDQNKVDNTQPIISSDNQVKDQNVLPQPVVTLNLIPNASQQPQQSQQPHQSQQSQQIQQPQQSQQSHQSQQTPQNNLLYSFNKQSPVVKPMSQPIQAVQLGQPVTIGQSNYVQQQYNFGGYGYGTAIGGVNLNGNGVGVGNLNGYQIGRISPHFPSPMVIRNNVSIEGRYYGNGTNISYPAQTIQQGQQTRIPNQFITHPQIQQGQRTQKVQKVQYNQIQQAQQTQKAQQVQKMQQNYKTQPKQTQPQQYNKQNQQFQQQQHQNNQSIEAQPQYQSYQYNKMNKQQQQLQQFYRRNEDLEEEQNYYEQYRLEKIKQQQPRQTIKERRQPARQARSQDGDQEQTQDYRRREIIQQNTYYQQQKEPQQQQNQQQRQQLEQHQQQQQQREQQARQNNINNLESGYFPTRSQQQPDLQQIRRVQTSQHRQTIQKLENKKKSSQNYGSQDANRSKSNNQSPGPKINLSDSNQQDSNEKFAGYKNMGKIANKSAQQQQQSQQTQVISSQQVPQQSQQTQQPISSPTTGVYSYQYQRSQNQTQTQNQERIPDNARYEDIQQYIRNKYKTYIDVENQFKNTGSVGVVPVSTNAYRTQENQGNTYHTGNYGAPDSLANFGETDYRPASSVSPYRYSQSKPNVTQMASYVQSKYDQYQTNRNQVQNTEYDTINFSFKPSRATPQSQEPIQKNIQSYQYMRIQKMYDQSKQNQNLKQQKKQEGGQDILDVKNMERSLDKKYNSSKSQQQIKEEDKINTENQQNQFSVKKLEQNLVRFEESRVGSGQIGGYSNTNTNNANNYGYSASSEPRFETSQVSKIHSIDERLSGNRRSSMNKQIKYTSQYPSSYTKYVSNNYKSSFENDDYALSNKYKRKQDNRQENGYKGYKDYKQSYENQSPVLQLQKGNSYNYRLSKQLDSIDEKFSKYVQGGAAAKSAYDREKPKTALRQKEFNYDYGYRDYQADNNSSRMATGHFGFSSDDRKVSQPVGSNKYKPQSGTIAKNTGSYSQSYQYQQKQQKRYNMSKPPLAPTKQNSLGAGTGAGSRARNTYNYQQTSNNNIKKNSNTYSNSNSNINSNGGSSKFVTSDVKAGLTYEDLRKFMWS